MGANVGNWTRDLLERYPKVTVHAFEPVPETYRKLTCALAHLPNVQTHQIALAQTTQPTSIFLYEFSELNSLNHISESDRQPTNKIVIEALTLDEFCAQQQINRIDLLKLDIEGAELQALAGGIRAMAFTQRIYSEFGMYSERHTPFDRLIKYLEQYDFSVSCFFNEHVWESGVFGKGSILLTKQFAD